MLHLVWLLLACLALVDSKCNHSDYLKAGEVKYASSPGFPVPYRGRNHCLWQYQSEPGRKIVIACELVHLSQDPECKKEYLIISLTGDSKFKSNKKTNRKHCGKTNFVQLSQTNKISLGFVSSGSSNGSSFFCSATGISVNSTNLLKVKEDVKFCDCGKINYIVQKVNGRNRTSIQYPFMVGIYHRIHRRTYCGASIISQRFVLTAGRCVKNTNRNLLAVIVGGDPRNSALHPIHSYQIHPRFDPHNPERDVAVVGVSRAFAFSSGLSPVCLPFRFTGRNLDGQPAHALGWSLSHGSRSSLKNIDVTILPNEECGSIYGQKISGRELCVVAQSNKRCRDSAGGPILWYDTSTKRMLQVGVFSSPGKCSGIESKVTPYLSWIIENTDYSSYCIK